MTSAELHAGEISRSASGAMTGTLYLKVGEQCFPDAGWSDFVVVVLEWWCSALVRLHQGELEPISVPFMDGPYKVRLEALADGQLSVILVSSRGQGDEELPQGAVDRQHLTQSVVAAAQAALAQCRIRGWASRDIDTLRDSLRALSHHKASGGA